MGNIAELEGKENVLLEKLNQLDLKEQQLYIQMKNLSNKGEQRETEKSLEEVEVEQELALGQLDELEKEKLESKKGNKQSLQEQEIELMQQLHKLDDLVKAKQHSEIKSFLQMREKIDSNPSKKDEDSNPSKKDEDSTPSKKEKDSTPSKKDEDSNLSKKDEDSTPSKKDEDSTPSKRDEDSTPSKKEDEEDEKLLKEFYSLEEKRKGGALDKESEKRQQAIYLKIQKYPVIAKKFSHMGKNKMDKNNKKKLTCKKDDAEKAVPET